MCGSFSLISEKEYILNLQFVKAKFICFQENREKTKRGVLMKKLLALLLVCGMLAGCTTAPAETTVYFLRYYSQYEMLAEYMSGKSWKIGDEEWWPGEKYPLTKDITLTAQWKTKSSKTQVNHMEITSADLDSIPVLAPEGAIVPMYHHEGSNDLSLDQPLDIHIWHGNGIIDIDCGCGHETELRRLACLRLDDMTEFYI